MTIVSACTQDNDYQPTEEISGEVTVSLQTEEYAPQSKASIEVGVPKAEDLTIEIFKKTDLEDVRLYRETYGKIKDKTIKLNCADYRLVAFHGDPLAAGEDLAYYEGVAEFSLTPHQRQIEVSAVARVSNVRVSVEYGDNLLNDYTEYYSIIRSVTAEGKKRSVEFYQDEVNKKAFLPYGTIHYELYAKVDGAWKYYPAKPVEASKGDDIVFKVDTKRLTGQQGITVTISQLEQIDRTYEVGADMLPQDSPEISTSMQQIFEMVEGDAPKTNLKMNIVADGNVRECWLNVNSAYLAALGVPERVDIASEQIAPRVQAALESVGLKWMKSMAGRRFAYVDFSGITDFISKNQCDPDNLFSADFSLEIIDERHNPGQTGHSGTIKSKTYSFVQGVPVPSVSVSGFENGAIEILEGTGVTYDGLKASVTAKGRIGHCYLDITSPYLAAAGIPSKVDLCNIDSATADKLRGFGLDWPADIAYRTQAEIDFSGMSDYMETSMYSASKGVNFATFSISVKNEITLDAALNNASGSVGSFRYLLPEASVSTIQNYNVWARKINDFSVNLTKGNPQQVKLQYSTGNGQWTDIAENTALNSTVLSCSSLATSPATPYTIRAIYHNNPDLCLEFNQVTTEAAAQIPNSDFETWSEFSHKYTPLAYSPIYYIWHRPYGSNLNTKVWDINAKISMPDSDAAWTNPNVKCFPCAGRSTDRMQGNYSALIFVVNISYRNTDDVATGTDHIGELFIGSANDSGSPTYGTTAFPSRPTSFKMNYKYQPKGSENFAGEIKIYSGQTVIAQAKFEDGSAASSWTSRTIPLSYSNTTMKATHASISFKATTAGNPGVNTKTTIEYNGGSYTGHFGSQLRLDDLQFIYE